MKKPLLFLLLLFFPAVFSIELLIYAPEQANYTFNATLVVEEIKNFDAADFIVDFDQTKLRLEKVYAGELTANANIGFNPQNNKVLINLPSVSGVSGSGSLAIFEFSSLKPTKPNISLKNITLSDTHASRIKVTEVKIMHKNYFPSAEAPKTSSKPTQTKNQADSLARKIRNQVLLGILIAAVILFVLVWLFKPKVSPPQTIPVEQAPLETPSQTQTTRL